MLIHSLRLHATLAFVLLAACQSPRRVATFDAGPTPDSGSSDTGTDANRMDMSVVLPDAFVAPDLGMSNDAAPARDMGRDTGPDAGVNRCTGIDCSAITIGCQVGVCNPATGTCGAMPLATGAACTDGNTCTTGDMCNAAGTCVGVATDCSALNGPCAMGMCVAATGACMAMPLADGASCGTGGAACMAPVCRAGACVTAPTADCGSCGAGMVCNNGACGAPPASLTYTFESNTIPASWTASAGSTSPWMVTTTSAHGGTHSMRAGVITHSQSSGVVMRITLANAASLSFWVHTDTESCCDHLAVFVDGVMNATQWSGATAWMQVSLVVSAGAHTIEWRYTKDGSISTGMDTVWVDDIVFSQLGSTNPSTGFEGSASLPAGYVGGGTLPFVIDTTMPHTGTRAAASGRITHSQTSSMTTTFALGAATTVTFWYRVDSEACCDHLFVYDNGVQLASYQGAVPWAMASFPLAVGAHTIEWRYSKDGSISTGLDRAFVDDVVVGAVAMSGPICM